jgi:GNAT superfamily N-acetyltransferase
MGVQDFPGVYRLPKSVNIRRGGNRDVNYIKDIDMKSYQYPWSHEQWAILGEDETYHWCVASRGVEPVGFAAWQNMQYEHRHPGLIPTVSIERLAVKPSDRREGIGTALIEYVCKYAEDQFFNRVVTVVPEINCLPGDPDDISAWLLAQGFRAELPILKDHVCHYGKLVDCYTFARSLRGGTNESTQ